MDSGGVKGCNCNGTEPSVSVDSKEEGVDKGENEDTEANGGLPGKSLRRSRRKVRWNDHNGKELVEVLEFQPSDSSDSESEYGDPCICAVM